MTSAAAPWPEGLAGTPVIEVIEQATREGRLPHGLLLAGNDPERLSAAALALADRILARGSPAGLAYPAERHPDCHHVRPGGPSRQIKVDAVRAMIDRVNMTPSVSREKVVLVHDADRLNPSSSTALLKALEEPPQDTTMILLTSRPQTLLPTIRSRVHHYRLPNGVRSADPEGWAGWLADYGAWLERLGRGVADASAAAEGIFGVYGLLARFGHLLDRASTAELERRKGALPEGLTEEEHKAIEAQITVGLKLRMFTSVAEATRAHAKRLIDSGESGAGRPLSASIDALERAAGLLRVNLNESVALEDFFLAALRIWAKR